MKIGFFNSSKTLSKVGFSDYTSNPGIGGTEYVTMRILYQLANKNDKHEFYLLSYENVVNETNLQNLHIVEPQVAPLDVCVIPKSQYAIYKNSERKDIRPIIWSHHPHDEIDEAIPEAIFLGDYHCYSNRKFTGKKYIIKNPAPKPLNFTDKVDAPYKFVYLGAIGPAKGLHHILKFWPRIKQINPKARLSIIGGDLYGEGKSNSQNFIPVTGKYGHRLKKLMSRMKKCERESIFFHGLVSDIEKNAILRHSHIALLNPTGKSEAAPASPLECYCYGIPVIAAGDYGAYDNMRVFPELDLKKKKIESIISFISNPESYEVVSERSKAYAKKLYGENEIELEKWINLFDKKLDTPEIDLPYKFRMKISFRDVFLRTFKYPLRSIMK